MDRSDGQEPKAGVLGALWKENAGLTRRRYQPRTVLRISAPAHRDGPHMPPISTPLTLVRSGRSNCACLPGSC